MVVLCNYLVYRYLDKLGVGIFIAGFRDKEQAEEYMGLLKSKYPKEEYCIREVKEVETLRNS
jgi:aryl-alcohol dehydrogenase-like predicted oxidoreductase